MIKYKHRKNLIVIVVMLTLLLAFLGHISCLLGGVTIAHADPWAYSADSGKPQQNRLYVSNFKSNYHVLETIDLNFTIETSNAVVSYEYETIGFDVISDSMLDNNIIVRLKYLGAGANSEFHLTANFANGTSMTDRIFSFVQHDDLFLSDASYDDAQRQYIFFAYGDEYFSEEETVADGNGMILGGIVDSKNPTNALLASDTTTETISAQLQWRDDSAAANIHPLAYTKFSITDRGGSSAVTKTYYTDGEGRFPDNVTVTSPRKIDLKIYASGANTSVHAKNSSGTAGEVWSKTYTNFNPDNSIVIEMGDDYGKAQQISQALIYSNLFVKEMRGSVLSAVKAVYPHNETCYYYSTSEIHLSGTSSDQDYADWDVIMHEYGHHVGRKLGIDNSPGGKHSYWENLAEKYGKDKGIRLAWSEAWATIFGAIAQDYFATELTGIIGVADGFYSDYAGKPDPTDTIFYYDHLYYGSNEANECAIICFLWDLYDIDTRAESHDYFQWGAKKLWSIIIKSQAKTFSDFNLYLQTEEFKDDPDSVSKLGASLNWYDIAPEILTPSGELGESAPTISWRTNGSSSFPNNRFALKFYASYLNQDYQKIIQAGNADQYTLTYSEWQEIFRWGCPEIKFVVAGFQADSPETGPYVSGARTLPKPMFKTRRINDEEVAITGAYCDIVNLMLGSELDNRTITQIDAGAFRYQTQMELAMLPSTITKIGARAFEGCTKLTAMYLGSLTLSEIEDYTFDGCPIETMTFPKNLTVIGNYAFRETSVKKIPSTVKEIGIGAFEKNNGLTSLTLTSSMSIGNSAFKGSSLTIYTNEASNSTFASYLNSSNRPVVYGCQLSSDKTYVVSCTKSSNNPANVYLFTTVNTPTREGYKFEGWYTASNFSGTKYDDILSASNGEVLYAKWAKDASACVAEGTMITLADGTQKAVETLAGDEMLLVWNLWTGDFEAAPILFIDHEVRRVYDVINLTFSDGTTVKVIDEHGFWDVELNKYVFLRADASKYIGHRFKKETGEVTLIGVEVKQEVTTAWSPVTFGHLCYYVNGMLSMPGATEGLINIFEVDTDTMKIDEEKYLLDVETYGLFTYEEFSECFDVPEVIFEAFGGQYLKVAIGKGILTEEMIEALIERYAPFFQIEQ